MTPGEETTPSTQPTYQSSASRPALQHRTTTSDTSRLAPDDAFSVHSPPRRERQRSPLGLGLDGAPARGTTESRRKRRGRSGSRRKKGTWKKLLWVKQSYPDNYTDEETFLDHLQRNPHVQPYEFWPLIADSTVIVQHVCAVTIFVCCFAAIYQERVSPVGVVSWGSLSTVLGWVLWDFWVGQEEAANASAAELNPELGEDGSTTSSASSIISAQSAREGHVVGLAGTAGNAMLRQPQMHGMSTTPSSSNTSVPNVIPSGHPTGASTFASYSHVPPYGESTTSLSPRNQQRLATAKSAILIYCALLGLSPILKSLTKSTTSDSIWAMSTWLMCINVFFFDYGGGVGAKFPASLSTNAAVMASTVLASRLPSTTHVFSLILFSIEVFGLFPVFRRHLRHISWRGHLLTTIALVMGAGGGVAVTVSGGGWKAAMVGVVLGCFLTSLAMGICSWWLIGLQKYKNEIHGPWDPARPIIRRRWD